MKQPKKFTLIKFKNLIKKRKEKVWNVLQITENEKYTRDAELKDIERELQKW
jgi:hypothetical protein